MEISVLIHTFLKKNVDLKTLNTGHFPWDFVIYMYIYLFSAKECVWKIAQGKYVC